nr:2'-5' RNA ligase family protein [Rhodohalobacter sp. 614A]
MIPEEQAEMELGKSIQDLAEKYQSEPFQPHLTLAGIPHWTEEQMVKEIQKISGSTLPIELFLEKVQCKRFPYQKITIEVERTEELHALHQETDRLFGGDYSKTEYPHISLLYSTLECGGLQKTVSQLNEQIPPKVLLDRIALIRCKGTPEAWRTLYMRKLG